MKALYLFATAGMLSVLATNFALAQGSLTPPGPPQPLFKTLQQVEPRTPISSLPVSITNSGSYYLTTNLTGLAGTNGITIAADDVTLDLMGFAVTGVPTSGLGIQVVSGGGTLRKNITIRNGTVSKWGDVGLNLAGAQNSRIENLSVSDNASIGIAAGPENIVTACLASTNGKTGIQAGIGCIVRDCTASLNSQNGFTLSQNTLVSQCNALRNKHNGFLATGACYLFNNTATENGSATTNAAGFLISGGGGARIDSNVSINNTNMGFRVLTGGNLLIRNSARGHATNYVFAINNLLGATNMVSDLNTDTNPWRNFSQ